MYTNEKTVPIWEKYSLKVKEAAEYFGIGENKLRDIANDNKEADYLLWIGNRVQFKRALFEKYLNEQNVM